MIKPKDKGNKANKENKKLKTKLKQVTTELEEVMDGAVDLVKTNSKVIVEEFKKGPKF